jgi:hypothetical protein
MDQLPLNRGTCQNTQLQINLFFERPTLFVRIAVVAVPTGVTSALPYPQRSDRSLTVVRSVRWNSVEHRILWFDKALRVARLLPSFQRFVFNRAASRGAPVREAVISVPARSRSRTR